MNHQAIVGQLQKNKTDKNNTTSICINVPTSFRNELKEYSTKNNLSISLIFRTVMKLFLEEEFKKENSNV